MPTDKLQQLAQQRHGFAVFPEVRIFDAPGGKSIQHLLFGDYITPPKNASGNGYQTWTANKLQEHDGEQWLPARSRQEEGWIRLDDIQVNRILEVNFVDIGQGDGCHLVTPTDEHFIIDAGKGDNMYRFLRWRFNLSKAGGRLPPFYAVISHPDEDHYKGFTPLFSPPASGQSRQIVFNKIYHNGIIQRAGSSLGDSIESNGQKYLSEVINTHQQLLDLLGTAGSKSNYEKVLQKAVDTFPQVSIEAVSRSISRRAYLYNEGPLKLEILAPVPEKIAGKKRLRWFNNNVGKTKNGHSVVLMARIGKMNVLLGGDLNSKSADYLMSQYSGKDIEAVKQRIATTGDAAAIQELQEIIETCRVSFGAEVAKSCHHGSNDITNELLETIQAIATVISSGDEESFCHPRPETLGAIGKYGRGERPLIYSTELARSSPEYITIQKEAIKTDRVKQRVVSTYGMITLRTDGENAILAQKLEKQRSSFGLITKWQIDKLIWNDERNTFVSKK